MNHSMLNGLRLLDPLPLKFPFLPYLLGFLSGISLAFVELRDCLAPNFFPILLFSSAIYLASVSRKRIVLKIVFVLLFGIFGFHHSQRILPENHIHRQMKEGKYGMVEGIMWTLPSREKERTVFKIKLQRIAYDNEWKEAVGTAKISLYSETEQEWRAGDVLLFKKIKLKKPRNFKNPGRFNYLRFLRLRGIDVTGGTSRPDSIEKSGEYELPFWVDLRESILEKLYSTIDGNLSEQEGSLLRAMVFGDKSGLSENLRDAFAVSGIGHLTAVSGLHIGFVAGFSLLIFRPVVFNILWRWFPGWARSGMAPKISALIAVFPVLFYMLLAGDKASALRAGFMVIVVLFALLADREKNASNALLLAGFLILLYEPEGILDAGFQMSFAAVAGILFILNAIAMREKDAIDRMGEIRGLDRWMMPADSELLELSAVQKILLQAKRIFIAGTIISLAAILGTLPFVLYQFHLISLSGFILNPFLTPLASLLIPLALVIALASALFPNLGILIFWPVKILMIPFIKIPLWVSRFSWSSFYWPSPGPLWPVLWYLFLFTGIKILFGRKFRKKEQNEKLFSSRNKILCTWAMSGLLAVCGFIWPQSYSGFSEKKLSVTMLDVGQGESIFIQFPNGRTMLIDGGGFYKNSLDVGKRVVAPFLWNQGIGKIDYMIASHSDNDHISGLESLIHLFPVDSVAAIVDPAFRKTWRARKWIEDARQAGARYLPLEIGKPVSIGEARITALHPDKNYRNKLKSEGGKRIANNLSIVLKLEYRRFSMLFTGDIENDAEDYLRMKQAPVQSDYLKAAHHGSRNSSSEDFVKSVAPKAALFSSGYLNWARHPHNETLNRFNMEGVSIWRTDLQGAITLTTDGRRTHIIGHPDL